MEDQSSLSDFEAGESQETNLYECEICDRVFDSAKGRGIHRAKAHDEEEIKQVLITELQRLADKLGRTPELKDMNEHGAHSSKTYQKKFGSWNEAIEEAGFETNKEGSIAKSDLRDELERLADQLGRTPTSRDMAEDGKYATSNYSRKFGSWNDAVREVGLEPTRDRDVPREELIDEIQRLAEELGGPPTVAEMKEHGDYGVSTCSNEFGTWNEALKTAGVGTNKQKDVPESDLLAEIHSLSEHLGRTPSALKMSKDGGYSVGAYERRFGSWNEALREAGFEVNNRSDIPDAELIAELHRLAKELGRTPRAVDMTEHSEYGQATYSTSFGSWSEALNRADLEHEKILHPDHLDHLCRSGYEVEVAEILLDTGVEYEYEGLVIEYGDGRTYTPDFVTEQYVIEVKGYVHRNEKELAEIALGKLDNRKYVVVQNDGTKLPADIHITWENRETIRGLFE